MDLRRGTLRSAMILLAVLVGVTGLISCGDDSSPTGNTPVNHDPAVPALDGGGPADGATGVPLSVALEWSCTDSDGDALTYAVHFGQADPPPAVVANQAATEYAPAGLLNETTYYWMIVAKDDADATTSSPVWSFTTAAAGAETITPPTRPTGPMSGEIGETLDYTTVGATNSEGHTLEFRYTWGDGTSSDWSTSKAASHSWATAGGKAVTVQARCQAHPSVVSGNSIPLSVQIHAPETVSTPAAPTGSASGDVGQSINFTRTNATSSLGHTLEYEFDWGNGSTSGWVINNQRQYSWSADGVYQVTVTARCQEHTSVVSAASAPFEIAISAATETVNTPNLISPPASGGVGDTLEFTASAAPSSLGDAVEFRFDWGDGSMSPWSLAKVVGHVYTAGGSFEVKAQTRCGTHTSVVSDWSYTVTVEISAAVEEISKPVATPSNDGNVTVGALLYVSQGSATSSHGHAVEYRADLGTGEITGWAAGYGFNATWETVGDYEVKVQARCAEHTAIESVWSDSKPVHVLEAITQPTIGGPATGPWGSPVTFTASDAVSSEGHALEYAIYRSSQSYTVGTPGAWGTLDYTFPYAGTFYMRVQARCIEHPAAESIVSLPISISVAN